MLRVRTIVLSSLAVLALSAVGASAALAAPEGPKWKVAGAELTASESREIKFKSGTVKLEVPGVGVTVTCEKGVQLGTANDIKGGGINPGTGEAKILFEKCSTSATCKAFNVGTENIQLEVNTELTYETEEAALKHEEPVGMIFRTKANGVSELFKIKFSGTGCPLETTVHASGNAVGSIAGKAGLFCKIELVASKEKLVHELNCPLVAVKKAWNYIAKELKEHKIGLEAFSFEAKEVGKFTIEVFLLSIQEYSVIL